MNARDIENNELPPGIYAGASHGQNSDRPRPKRTIKSPGIYAGEIEINTLPPA